MSRIRTLLGRVRGASRGQLWAALIASCAFNIAVLGSVIAYMPIVPLRPICTNRASPSIWGESFVEIDGEMARPFLFAYRDMLHLGSINHLNYPGRIYVRLSDWLDHDQILNMSYKATTALLAERTGASIVDIINRRLGLPEFDDVESYDWPPCGAMRKLAIKGGEWSIKGPEPRKRD